MKTKVGWLVLAFVVATACTTRGYSEGERVGTLFKFSRKGLFWKTWEGEVLLGGLRGSSGSTANTWEFSVRRQDAEQLVPALKAAADSGNRVRLYYSQALWSAPWYATTYFVDSVRIVGRGEP